MNIKSFECPKSVRYYEKRIMLETSDTWSMSRSSHRPSKPVYYIEDCWIFRIISDANCKMGLDSPLQALQLKPCKGWKYFAVRLKLFE